MKTKESFMQLMNDNSVIEADVHFARCYCSGALRNQTARIASFQVDYFASEETRGQ